MSTRLSMAIREPVAPLLIVTSLVKTFRYTSAPFKRLVFLSFVTAMILQF